MGEQVGKLNSALAAQAYRKAERYTQLESTTTAELEAKQSELEAKLAAQAERYTQLESTTTAELEAKQSELEAKQSELATCKNSIKTCDETCEKRIADIQDYSDKGIGK